MISIRPISIHTFSEAATELEKLGFPSAQAKKLATETLGLHLKVEGIHDETIPYLQKNVQPLSPISNPVADRKTCFHYRNRIP
jgi:hypothetical protein